MKDQEIICFSAGDWSPPWMPEHHVMRLLCRQNRVLFVEPPVSFPGLSAPTKYFRWTDGIRRIEERLFAYNPPPVFPLKRALPLVNWISQKWVIIFVKRIVNELGFKKPIVWVFWPTAVEMIGHFSEKLVVYHEADEMTLIPYGTGIVLNKMEQRMLKKSDLVITCSEEVYRKKKQLCKNIINIPNGIDLKIFSNVLKGSFSIPKDLDSIKHPRIGFSGVIDRRFDFNLIKKIASFSPDMNIVLIGPHYISISKLENIKNVHYLGMKPPELVPLYIKHFDVCIIPYLRNEYVKSLSPLKMMEYFAMGKPIVSVPITGIEEHLGLLYVAKDENEFIEAIRLVLKEENPSLGDQRKRVAGMNTWENKVQAISSVIEEVLRVKRQKEG